MASVELVIRSIGSGLRLKQIGMESRLWMRLYEDGLVGGRHAGYEMNEL